MGLYLPLGVYTLATLRLGTTLQLGAFTALGVVLTDVPAAMWLLVALKTLQGGWRGNLFVSPCIAGVN